MGQNFNMFFNITKLSGRFCITNFQVLSDSSTLPKMLTHSLLKQSECLSDIAGIAARTIKLVNNRGAEHLGNSGLQRRKYSF